MNDETEFWRANREESQLRRATNREHAAQELKRKGVPFSSHNDGAHLVLKIGQRTVDYWPGTGLWVVRGTRDDQRQRGLQRLLAFWDKHGDQLVQEAPGARAWLSPCGKGLTFRKLKPDAQPLFDQAHVDKMMMAAAREAMNWDWTSASVDDRESALRIVVLNAKTQNA